MRFASLNNSNASNYAQAGKEASNALADSFSIMRKTGPDYAMLSKVAMATRSAEKVASLEAQAYVGSKGLTALGNVTTAGIKARTGVKFAEMKGDRIRKAGKVAAIGGILGGAVLAATNKKEDNSWKDKYEKQRDAINQGYLNYLEKSDSEEGSTPFQPRPFEPSKNQTNGGSTQTSAGAPANPPPSSSQTQAGSPSGSVNSFAQAVDVAKSVGSPYPQLKAAQWALESGYGKSISGTNNYFGIKAGPGESGTSKGTWEVVNGKEVNTSAKFKNYASAADAFAELNDRWYKKYKGYTGVGSSGSADAAARALQQQGYATDPNYANKLIKIMRDNGF